MAFNKRRKQTQFFRGTNPHPTAEEVRAGAGTHVGRVDHPSPHPTEEHARAIAAAPVATKKPRGPKLGKAKRVKHG